MNIASEAEQAAMMDAARPLVEHAVFVSGTPTEDLEDRRAHEFNVALTAAEGLIAALMERQDAIADSRPIVEGVGYALGGWLAQQPPDVVAAVALYLSEGINRGFDETAKLMTPKGRA